MVSSAATALVLLAAAGGGAPLTIGAPPSVASGEAARIFVRAAGPGLATGSVVLAASAGSLGVLEPQRDGSLGVVFTAPRVAAPMYLELRASGRGPLAGSSASAKVRVEAAPFVPTPKTSAGPLAIRAPDRVLLGATERVDITLEAASRPAAVLASTGHGGALERAGDGGWRLSYLPPPGRAPRVAIVAFVDTARRILDWTAVRLYGLADVTVDTEPRARVAVEVEGETFGPVRADEQGRARISVAVPPGVGQAVARAIDELGNESQIAVDLAVPGFQRVLASCRTDGDEVEIVTVGSDGEPSDPRGVRLSSSVGSSSPLEALENGVWRSRIGVPGDVAAGTEVTVAAQAKGDPAPATCTLQTRAGPPARVSVALDRDAYVAGSGTPVQVVVSVADADGRPTGGAEVKLTADLGELTPARLVAEGVVQALWLPGDSFGEHSAAVVRAAAGKEPRVVGAEAVLRLTPARAERLELSADADRVRADGRQSVRVHVRPLDAFGNTVRDAEVYLSADGRLGELEYDGARRRFDATYTAHRRHAAGSDTVYARLSDSGVVETLKVRLDPSPLSAAAVAKIGVARLGGLFAPMLQVEGGTRLLVIDDRLLASVSLGATLRSTTEVAEGERVESTMWAAPLAARLGFHWSYEVVELSGGVLAGAALVGYRLRSPLVGHLSALRVTPYVGVSAGASWAALNGRMVLEATWARARLEDAAVKADVLGAQLSAGYRVDL